MERLHPVTGEQEAPVEVEIATLVAVDFNSQSPEDLGLVEPLGNPAKLHVAKLPSIFAFRANIIRVLTRSLIGANHGIIAIN